MWALNTLGRPFVAGDATIGGGGAADRGALFPPARDDMSLGSKGGVGGAANQAAVLTDRSATVRLSDGTSIAFTSVRAAA